MNICAVNSLWIWLCRVGARMMCGMFSMLMLLAQNLLTQRRRASATLTLFFVIIITMKHILRSAYSSSSTLGQNEMISGGDSGCFHICAGCNTLFVSVYLLLHLVPVL